MKASELMIGDIVAVNKTPLRIAALGTVKAGFLDAKGEMFYQYYDNIAPIPLTKKILKENGFREDENGHFEYWGDEDDNLWIQVQFDIIKETPICYNIATPHNGRFFEICDSVHELQNALRLCDISKEINL